MAINAKELETSPLNNSAAPNVYQIRNSGKPTESYSLYEGISMNNSKELTRQIDAIFDSSFDGLYMTDGEGNTLRLNKSFERITGLSASVCVGRNMADLVEEGIYSRSGTLIALRERRRITTTLKTATGKTVLATSNPIFDDRQNIVLVVTAICDITELNDLQRKTLEKEAFIEGRAGRPVLELPNKKRYMVRSPEMRSLVDMTIRIAASDSTVLIQGESGVGKELIVDLIHANSTRKHSPLIKVNCGAIPENLLESELFGYEPGAFSGASKNGKTGYFEKANTGTLFLDEIAEMPLNLQVKLLRVLQEKEVGRIGGGSVMKLDVRIIAATNQNLYEMVQKNMFRHDLYYRLNVVPIYVPALRDRKDDIPALTAFFLDAFNARHGTHKRLSPEVLQCFSEYPWPGNIRELENLMERLVITVVNDTITMNDLPAHLTGSRHDETDVELAPLRPALENLERQMLESAFARYHSTYEVARVLGINQSTVVRKAAKYGIKRD